MSRILILASKLGYQTRSFAEAARNLKISVLFATDRCHQLDDPWSDGAVPVHFDQPQASAQQILARIDLQSIDGLIALGDAATETAAYVAASLDIDYNSPQAVQNCRSKLRQREVLRAAGLCVPDFFSFPLSAALPDVFEHLQFPCVIKPLRLSASQGVIRANTPVEFRLALERIRRLMQSPEVQVTREADLDRVLVERYIPGVEVAVEGLLTHGKLRVLAIFDKPNPLEGPYFEESIYVTPSRLPQEAQDRIHECAAETAQALGLVHGPLHAEFRLNEQGAPKPWILEASPRPIGGLCSRALRFGPGRIPLEELLIRHAMKMEGAQLEREAAASGVMMIPVPRSGVLLKVDGEGEARAMPGIEDIQITARLQDFIAAWPEGSSYLGFIFSRGETPTEAESALRKAHAHLKFEIVPRLAVEHPILGKFVGTGIEP